MANEQDVIHWGTIVSSGIGTMAGGIISLIGIYWANRFQLRMQKEKEKNEDKRFQSSLFFDHRRIAFAEILTKIAEINQKWLENGDELFEPLPVDAYKDLRMVFYKHQLFLDESCLDAMDLVFECYREALPDEDGRSTGTEDIAYSNISYLQPRLAKLFRQKIGASNDVQALRDIILLQSIRLLNRYGLGSKRRVESPIVSEESPLKMDLSRISPEEAVSVAVSHFSDLLSKLEDLKRYLAQGSYREEKTVARCLVILKDPGREIFAT